MDFGTGFDDMRMPTRILVLDTETTGLKGALYEKNPFGNNRPDYDGLDWSRYGDVIVDIGICEVDLDAHTVHEVYSSIVGYDVTTWTEEMKTSWIFGNTDLTVDQVASAKPFSQVKKEVSDIVRGKWLTTYNVQYDLDKFLYRFPWDLKGTFMECRDIMFCAKDVCRLESRSRNDYRYPKLDYAYEHILHGEDPAGIDGVQDHRALSDAKVASYLLLKLNDDGVYNPLDYSGRHGSLR